MAGYDTNENRPLERRICHFGKYAGVRYREIPTDYLRWFVANAYRQMKNRERWAREELAWRNAQESSPLLPHHAADMDFPGGSQVNHW